MLVCFCDNVPRSADPTGTKKLRAQLRKLFALQLNAMRTRLRAAVIDQNCLCLASDKVATSLPKEVCAASFDEHLKMLHAFPINAMLDLLKAATVSGIKAIGTPADVDHTLIYQVWVRNEVDGIVAALKQKLARIAIDVMIVRMSKAKAFRVMSAEFDKIGTRFDALANTVVVKLHNLGRIEALRSQGVEYYGIDAERVIDAPKKRKLTYTKPSLRFVKWQTAGDEKVCPRCEDLEGQVFTYAEVIGLLPIHLNCVPGDSLVSPVGRIAAASKRAYEGDLIVIRTAAGNELKITPNHPVCTDLGWIGAQFLNVGSRVVCYSGSDSVFSGVSHNYKHVPTAIENIAKTLAKFGSSVRAPLNPVDFHGDVANGYVDIVYADGFLISNRSDFSFRQHAAKKLVEFRDSDLGTFQSLSALCSLPDAVLSAAYCGMRWFGKGLAFFRSAIVPIFAQVSSSSDCVSGGNLGFSLFRGHLAPAFEPSDAVSGSSFRHSHGFGARSNVGVCSLQMPLENVGAYAETFDEVRQRLPFGVVFDEVVELRRVKFSGFVHNLETSASCYLANNILVHNCRCAVTAFRPPHAKDAALHWEEKLHPRGGVGSRQGGKFVSKGAKFSAKPTTKARPWE